MLAIFSVLSLNAFAEDMVYTINVDLKTGETLKYSFDDEPTFVLGSTVVLKSKSVEVSDQELAYGNILKIYVTQSEASGINETQATTGTFRFSANEAFFGNVGENAKVSFYSVDGKQVNVDVQHLGQDVKVDLSSLSKGLYIIKVNNKSYKLLTK